MKPINFHLASSRLFLFFIVNIVVQSGSFALAEQAAQQESLDDNATSEASVAAEEEASPTEITITADPFNHSLLEHSSPASVLGKDEVLRRAEATIGETIGSEPGVSSSYFGPGASRPVIRGNAGDRIRVLKNGIGTLDVSNTSEDHAVSSNPLAAESIEILRGPETLLFGSSAIGGVVNITDNSIPEREIGAPLTGSADFRTGVADDELSGAVKLEGQAKKFNWHLDYFHQDTEDIEIPGLAESAALREQEAAEGEMHEEEESSGKLRNSATRSQGFTAGGSYVWEKGFFGISVSGNESKYGVPGHIEGEEHSPGEEAEEEEEEADVAIDLQQLRVDLRGRVDELSNAFKTGKFKLGLATYEHTEFEGSEVGTKFENDGLEGRLELTHNPILSMEGVLGFQTQASKFSAVGDESFLPATDTISPALFLFEELPLNDFWKLQAGTRYEFVNYKAEGFSSDEFHPLGFSTGVVWNPTGRNDYTVGLSFAFTQRSPSVSELYADGAHVARQIFEVGNPDLSVEQSYGLDWTMKKNRGLLTGAVNLFVQNYDDYINLSATGSDQDGLPAFNYESIRALFWGFETEATLHLHEALELWAHDLDLGVQVDFVRAKNESTDSDLPRIPPFRSIVGLDYRYKFLFGARVEGVFVAEQDKIADSELPTDSYQMLNADLNYNYSFDRGYELTFYVRGTNLTDEEARIHSSFLKDLAPLRGRSVLFGLRGSF